MFERNNTTWTVHFVQPCGGLAVVPFEIKEEAENFYATLPASWDKSLVPPEEKEAR